MKLQPTAIAFPIMELKQSLVFRGVVSSRSACAEVKNLWNFVLMHPMYLNGVPLKLMTNVAVMVWAFVWDVLKMNLSLDPSYPD
jgi:hypothetical protein